jgi:ubiquitin carboxyl-terminal hydrolase 7
MEVDELQQGLGAAMEVDENTKPEEAAPNPLAGEHMWDVSNVSTHQGKVLSEPFEIGGYSWQLLLYPRGNNRPDSLSLYLAVAEDDQQAFGLQRTAVFKLMLLNQAEGSDVVKDTQHTFTVRETDWGFTSFVNLTELRDPARGLLVDDKLRIKVSIEVRVPEDLSYDSRKETGFVGLKNQGATCYMNSLLQTLFNINQFRKAVYHMPTSEDADPATSMPLALQSVFYKLQFTAGPVSTKDLTRSFGWDTADAFQQHDVQELNRILCDRLEEKMKGTRVEGMVNKLFEGHTINYIECINVDYKSTRREPFMDVQLDVKNCKDIYASFDKYCEVEVLEGDNQYNAEQHGMQDARKGILFEGFPPVLQLQLKRFEYDFMKDMMVKVNDRYEFHDTIDLDREGGKYLSATADRAVRNTYKLLAVLVHSGGVHGGHYFAYVRPDGKQWLKFDDERVEKADNQKAIDDNWGGEGEAPPGGAPHVVLEPCDNIRASLAQHCLPCRPVATIPQLHYLFH